MKAIVITKSGPPDFLELKEVVKPSPTDNEVLIKVHAATATTGDVMMRKLHPILAVLMQLFGVKKKRIPGHEFAGVIEAAGKNVDRFKAGDRVVGTTSGLSVGANAEYVCIPVNGKSGQLSILPKKVGFEQAAAIPVGGMTALYLLKKGNIRSGQKVLVYGASGSVGTYAVQLAKHFGAEVTGVCSAGNIDLVKSLGADHVVDYTKDYITASGETYDLVFDAVGKLPSSSSKVILAPDGKLVSVKSLTQESPENLDLLIRLLASGEIKAVIDKCFPLDQTADAHRYVESGHKKGNAVISVVP